MNHLNTEKDFQKRGYKTPENYFEKFSQEISHPREEKTAVISRKYLYPIAAIIILLLGVGFFIQYNTSSISIQQEIEFAYEETLIYDSSFDFETNLISMLDESELESSLFEDIEMETLEDYIEATGDYEEYSYN